MHPRASAVAGLPAVVAKWVQGTFPFGRLFRGSVGLRHLPPPPPDPLCLQLPVGVFATVPNLMSLTLANNNIEALEREMLVGLRVRGCHSVTHSSPLFRSHPLHLASLG